MTLLYVCLKLAIRYVIIVNKIIKSFESFLKFCLNIYNIYEIFEVTVLTSVLSGENYTLRLLTRNHEAQGLMISQFLKCRPAFEPVLCRT